MANEMKELHGAVFELTPDMISAVSLDEIEVEDMTPKTIPAISGIASMMNASAAPSTSSQAWQSATAAVSASVTM